MTTTGHSHARRALGEGAGASRDPAKVRRHFQLRRDKHPQGVPDSSWQAQVRLCQRYRPVLARGKHVHQVIVAMARALGGCMGAMAQEGPVTPSGSQTAHAAIQQGARVSTWYRQRRSPGVVHPSTA